MADHELHAAQKRSVVDGDSRRAAELAHEAIRTGEDARSCIDLGYVPGIDEVGRRWESGEFFLPELMQGADAMKAAVAVLRPQLLLNGQSADSGATIVIGTVQGDIHDIGKTLVATFLEANGFRVVDLGRDVPLTEFVEAAEREEAQMVGMSALLTTTMPGQEQVIRLLDERGLKSRVAVLVGGAPVTRRYAQSIGADGFAASAVDAVSEAKRLAGMAT